MAKENNNKSFVLRIDAATMDALELWAADEFRSINGQLQWIIADALRRSGRLGPVRQSVCTVLNVRPLLTCREGAVVSCGMVRGHNEQMRALDQAVPENAGCIVVQYIRNINGARQLQHRLESRLNKTVLLRPIGPVLAIHLGVDMIGVAWREF